MPYFLSPEELQPGAETTLGGPEGAHLLGARRLKTGERFALQDVRGRRFEAELLGGARGRAQVRVLQPVAAPPLPPVRLTLLQAVVKDRAAEWIVQKTTELGVAAIDFFPAENSTVSARQLFSPRTGARWTRIAMEACKQCDRHAPPAIAVLPSLAEAIAAGPATGTGGGAGDSGWSAAWLLDPEAGISPAGAPKPGPGQPAARLLVGPEGGLSGPEREAALAAGFAPVRLGAQLLRAETAALAGCSLLLFAG